ncbi:sensor histidine kinase [Fulvivirga lutimaris]|uniref:sensor histidine kinase n=1 Tax=Fulvivirga lutimaris TaxID=1819566 RepID=UPI0012BBD1D4|nr:HAMP domain-containing sensor histidine kinase [Fulvivirga lutimaris]MTI40608.1 HAMP domain-containing histidine kinase [Fulvivirga lutimaris]
MKRSHLLYLINTLKITVLLLFLVAGPIAVHAQDTQVVQIKAFNEDLRPYGNIKVGINQGSLIDLNARGTAFANLRKDDFPIKSITIGDNTLEAASWNLSKGVLEITIRKKSYKDITVVIRNMNGEALRRQAFTYKGEKTINTTTDAGGSASLPMALNERITNASQFEVKGYKSMSVAQNGSRYVLKVALLNPVKQLAEVKPKANQPIIDTSSEDLETSVLSQLDSIQSLQEFYALFKGIRMDNLSTDVRNSIDLKFDELLSGVEGTTSDSTSYITNITDTTVVKNDLQNLLKEVQRENKRLSSQKSEFDNKIRLVNEKLNQGFENLSEEDREELLNDLNLLEELLANNENEFNENQNNYLAMITELKNRFFDLEKLEGQLSASEQKRLAEKKLYQQRILAISGLVLFFALLLLLLLYLRLKLKKQQKQLLSANENVKHINQNLESIVSERTDMLEKTYKELDLVLYRASHDLRAPLCSITGLSQLIALNTGDVQLTDLILKTNNQMDKLLKKLSTISEIHQPGTFSEVKLDDLIFEVTRRFDTMIRENNINLAVDCADDLDIVSIPYLLEVTLHNLLENALIFTSIKEDQLREVSIKVRKVSSQLLIEVYDNGIGIDKSTVSQLFEMFYKGTELSKGNGLGLYIVNKSVNVLKGNIEVDSVEGEYTRIIVNVPVDDSQGHAFDFIKQNELAEA